VIVLYKKNSQYAELSGLKDQSASPPTFVNDAVIAATLKDSAGADVTGFVAVAGAYQASSDGVYRFAVPSTFDPATGDSYVCIIDGSSGGRVFHIEVPAKVEVRRG
jgi:hypothetical protein